MKRFKSYCWNINFKETNDELLVKLYSDCILHNDNVIKEIKTHLLNIDIINNDILKHIKYNVFGLIISYIYTVYVPLFFMLMLSIFLLMYLYFSLRKDYLYKILPTFEDDNDFNEYMISEIKIKTIQKKYYSC